MTFDPFGDFDTRGYLRNFESERDPEIIRCLEHNSFLTGLEDAIRQLVFVQHLAYQDVLNTHRTLFEAVYPWAGQDRLATAPARGWPRPPSVAQARASPRSVRRRRCYRMGLCAAPREKK